MGIYLNPGNESFRQALASSAYVDKSKIIDIINPAIETRDDKYICITRPRRFGKTWTAEMLIAYYSIGCDSAELFKKLAIASEPTYLNHLNRHEVIHLNMADFYRSANGDVNLMLSEIAEELESEIQTQYPGLPGEWDSLDTACALLYEQTKRCIIFIIDEWERNK